MLRIEIDGKQIDARIGSTILEAASCAGIEIPGLCNDPRLKSCGACRICLVEVAGYSHPIVSCMSEPKDGMVIETEASELRQARAMNLRMLARKYPRAAFEN